MEKKRSISFMRRTNEWLVKKLEQIGREIERAVERLKSGDYT